MKICLSCNARFNISEWNCPECGFIPINKEGYLCFAPDLTKESEGFKYIF